MDDSGGFTYVTNSNNTAGSVDVWKTYLAVGLADLKLVNLDNRRTLIVQKPSEVSNVCPMHEVSTSLSVSTLHVHFIS